MRLRVLLAAIVIVFATLTAYLFVVVPSAHPHRVDAIVVLAGDRDRLDTGLRLLRERVAPMLALSRDPGRWPKADRLCVRPGFVCFHAHPYSTQGEAETVRRLATSRGWNTLVVVTSRYHLRRARMLFRRCLHSTVAFVAARTTFTEYATNIPREWAKLVYQLTIDRGC